MKKFIYSIAILAFVFLFPGKAWSQTGPCSGTPVAGSVSPANATLASCSGSTQLFTLLGATSDTGITYQWEQSPDNVNYTQISGATNATYTGTFTTGTTYVNCIVTCTNSGASAISTTATVGVTNQQSYASIPYVQNFESWTNGCGSTDNDVPDSNWTSSSPAVLSTANYGWRRVDYSTWTTIGLYNPAAQSGAYSARFHDDGVPGTGNSNIDLHINCSTSAGTQQLSFYYINTSGSDSLAVKLSTDGGATFTLLGTYTTAATWTQETLSFNSSSATTILRFTGNSVSGLNGSSDIGIDNLIIGAIAPCTGTPATGIISPASVTITSCSPAQMLTLSGIPLASGITYQWEQSTNGGGSYASVSGATNATYTGAFTAGTTLVNCIVSCTVSGSSTTSTTDTVTNTPQAYVPVTSGNPYTQSFENTWINTCATGDAPDAYWLNTPATGNASWRRDDNGATAAWTDPTGAAYTPAGSNANGASSSHSARFHSYFATSGTSGTVDLYLDLSAPGTKQISFDYINTSGTDNLQVLLSTTGPNGTFTPIESTLTTTASWLSTTPVTTTATSNTCVLRFKATSDYGETDIGLDNVSVSILAPCSGVPAVAAVSPANAALASCGGNTQIFTLQGVTGVTGVTYQWQQSTNGGSSYTPVSGATNTTYTGAFTAPSTLVNCIVTCTASGLSAISDTATVTYTNQQNYASLPYVQNFESWTNTCGSTDNDAPDSNWVNSNPNPLSDASSSGPGWRRSDYAGFGSSGMYNPAAESGSYSARFHVVSETGTGNLDLHINCSTSAGTQQLSFYFINTSGMADSLSVNLSTDGGATFTLLDNLTTVSSWTLETLTFTSTSPNTVIRFAGTAIAGLNGGTDVGIDNLNVFTLTPCSGTPVAGTVSPASAALSQCTGASQAFTLSGATLASGITYQWEQSTDGGNTYTFVPGATNATYTGAFTAGTTLVNCIIGCTTSGLSATSATDTVTNTPQAYVPVISGNPYTQNFENTWTNTCATGDAPGAYWINTPATGNASWRRDDGGATAAWTDPTEGAYTPAGSNANGASSSHSARFHSYFAPYDSIGSLALYLDLSAAGTKQISYDYINTSGTDHLAVLISATGILGPFTQIDSIVTSSTWATRTINTNANSATCVLLFKATSDYQETDIGLDNVSVSILAPCSGVPAVAAISPANAALVSCGGNTQIFTLPGVIGVTGLTYQWEQSTDGGVTYTPVSGATNTTYTGAFTAPSTLVNCIVTCTASGLFAISDTATVTYTNQQNYASLPYVQNFESWTNTCGSTDNDAPDSTWINSHPNPLSTLSSSGPGWRRSDYAGFGSSGMYNPAAESGSYSARFHVVSETGTGNLDLHINCSTSAGTQQLSFYFINTSGMADSVTINLSTDGGATFTLLNNLTTVSTWTLETLTFASTSPTTVIRFTGTAISGLNGGTDVGIDNLTIGTIAPCTGTPATGIISPANVNLTSCSPAQPFTLSGIPLASGITYQWEQSTNGGNSYTPVTGATNATYTGAFTAGTTLVNCIVSCTASGLSTISDTATVTYNNQQNYASLPYVQNFESWTNTCGSTDNDAPDSNWVNSNPNPLSDASSSGPGWRRSDYAGFGSSGMYNPAAESGSYSARFHVVSETGTGNLDLHINCSTSAGTQQLSFYFINTSGMADSLSVNLSTDGGATFTLLDNLTTVSSWTLETLTFTSTSPNTVIRFAGTAIAGLNGGTDVGIDNLNVFTLTPCSGTPVAGTVSPASAALSQCTGASQAFTLSGATLASGITYQWEQSTDGGNTYTFVPGATNAAYTGTFTADSTLVNCIVTCTNSGISATSTTTVVTYTPQLSLNVIADSAANVPGNGCLVPEFYIRVGGVCPLLQMNLLRVTTYFGDGQYDSVAFISSGATAYADPGHIYSAPGTYTIKQIVYYNNVIQDSITYSYEYNYCNTLPIKIYRDINGDCIHEISEPYNIASIFVAVDSNGIAIDTISATSGLYYQALGLPGTVYSFTFISAGMYASCPASGILYDTIVSSNSYPVKFFGLQCSGSTAFDLAVSDAIQATGTIDQRGYIYAVNNYCTPTNATVTLHYSPKYAGTPTGITPAAASVSGNTIVWNVSSLSSTSSAPVQLHYYAWRGSTPLTVGDTVQSYITISPVSGDADTNNNTQFIIDTVRAGVDPNEMAVSPGCLPPDSVTQLQYTINFTNTGNDTAFNISVTDTLSNNIDPHTLLIVNASATMNTELFTDSTYNIVKFDFPQINLLDSSYHDLCSGSVVFNINTIAGLTDNATILNHAGIIFDDNPVVMTNTVKNTVGCPANLGIVHVKPDIVNIYPNPASTELTITNTEPITNITISNLVGQTVYTQAYNAQQVQVNVANLAPGVYFVKINDMEVRKFVKE